MNMEEALPSTALILIFVFLCTVLLIIINTDVPNDFKTSNSNPSPAPAWVIVPAQNVAAAAVLVDVNKDDDDDDKLLELLKRRQPLLPDKVPSLLEACTQTFMKELTFFSRLPRISNPLDSVPTALRSHILERMGQHQLVLMHGKVQICDAVQSLLHCNLKSFDFKVCGPYNHPNGEALDREVLETLAIKSSSLEKIVDERLDQEATDITDLVPATQFLLTVVKMKNIKSIKLTGRYYWTDGDVSMVAEALPKLEVLWLQLREKPTLQLVDALSCLKCLKQLSWSVLPQEGPRVWEEEELVEIRPNLVPALVRRMPNLLIAGVAMIPDDNTWGHHSPLLYDEKIYPNLEHIKLGGEDFNKCSPSDLLYKCAKVPLTFPNITSLSLQTKNGLTDFIPLLQRIGSQLSSFRHDSDDLDATVFPNISALGALLQLAPNLTTLKLVGSMKYFGPKVPIVREWLSRLTCFDMSDECNMDSELEKEIVQIIKYAPNLKSLAIHGDGDTPAVMGIENFLIDLKNGECLQQLESCLSDFIHDSNDTTIELWKHLIVYCPKLRVLPRSILGFRRDKKMSNFLKVVNDKICPLYEDDLRR